MRVPMRAKRRSNETIVQQLNQVYPRAQVWTYTNTTTGKRRWMAELTMPNETETTQVFATKVEDLERWLHKHYPYLRGKLKCSEN